MSAIGRVTLVAASGNFPAGTQVELEWDHPRPAATSQAGRILAHLEYVGPITPLEALQEYGCLRLAARIRELRKLGWPIATGVGKAGRKVFARYWLPSVGSIARQGVAEALRRGDYHRGVRVRPDTR